ncbi:MAG: GAF domain-containing protein [SAR324 cluster bacterium]|nr:GAF domain-containing protein [SAR324 cluster bacterium]
MSLMIKTLQEKHRASLKKTMIILASVLMVLPLTYGMALVLKQIYPSERSVEMYLAGIWVVVGLFGTMLLVIQHRIKQIFERRRETLKDTFESMLKQLSHAQSLSELHELLAKIVFENLSASRFTTCLFREEKQAFQGWHSGAGTEPDTEVIHDESTSLWLDSSHPLISFLQDKEQVVSRNKMKEWLQQTRAIVTSDDILVKSELIQCVSFEGKMLAMLLLGPRVDHKAYSQEEQEFFHQVGVVLGPYFQNLALRQFMEQKIEAQTRRIRQSEKQLLQINTIMALVSDHMDTMRSTQEFLQSTVSILFQNMKGAVFLYDTARQSLVCTATCGWNMEPSTVLPLKMVMESGLTYDVFCNGMPALYSGTQLQALQIALKKLHQDQEVMEMLVAPLRYRETTRGVLVFSHVEQDFRFTQNDREFVSNLANSLTQHLENVRLYEQSTLQKLEFESVNQVIEIINTSMDLEQVLNKLLTVLQPVFQFNRVGVFLLNETDNTLQLATLAGEQVTDETIRQIKKIVLLLRDFTSYVCDCILKREPIYITPVTKEVSRLFFPLDQTLYELDPVCSYLLYPLEFENKPIGVIWFADTRQPFYLTEPDIFRVQLYINPIGTVIHNADLYKKLDQTREQLQQKAQAMEENVSQIQRREKKIQELNRFMQGVNTLDINALLKALFQALINKYYFDFITLHLPEPGETTLSLEYSYSWIKEPQDWKQVLAKIAMTQDPLNIWEQAYRKKYWVFMLEKCDAIQHKFLNFKQTLMDLQTILTLPVLSEKRVIGVITLYNFTHELILGKDHLGEIQQYVNYIAPSINNALLYQSSELQQKRLNAMLEELEKNHQELLRAQTQIVNSEKMAVMGTLVAGVAHEINTPAAAIQSAIHEIDRDYVELLTGIMNILRKLDPALWDLYAEACRFVVASDKGLSTEEQRLQAKDIQKILEAEGVDQARKISKELALIGFVTENLPPFLPLMKSPLVHEIRNSLTHLGLSQIHVSNIKIAVDRIVQMVKAFKHHARVDSAELYPTDLKEDLENTLIILKNQWKRGIQIVRDYEPIPPVKCFADQLNQVWTNLIHNAIQALKGTGQITLRISPHHETEVRVEVEDNGPGIPPEVLPRIFESYFTTKLKGEGSGLGLSIVKDIVENRHKGRIEVETQPGKTCFRIILPVTLILEKAT